MTALLGKVLDAFGPAASALAAHTAEVAESDWAALKAAAEKGVSEDALRVKAVVNSAEQSTTRGDRRIVGLLAGDLFELWGILHRQSTPPPPPLPAPEVEEDPLV